jgi:ubiquitin C-terminal hydrolase
MMSTQSLSLAQRIEEQKKMEIIRVMKEQQADGLVGLQNYSYFCYLNSCLQCLISIE